MLSGRTSGILLHPTSLPGPFGIGDLGASAYEFVDFLVKSGQQLWQVLPLGATGYGNSPYMCYSAFAGNPLLISPDLLVQAGWLDPAGWEGLPEWRQLQQTFAGRANFDLVIPFKTALLQQAWQQFQLRATQADLAAFQHFCQEQSDWLHDYALFCVLKDLNDGSEWSSWDEKVAFRDPQALELIASTYANELAQHQFSQWLFAQQWQALKTYANQHQVRILGDLPIYVAYNSADVWANPDLFELDETGSPLLVAGVPPDYFSPTGQLWGNPLYKWDVLKKQDYSWWIRRLQALFQGVDCVRIDHFRGFESYWAVAGDAKTAENGTWLPGPGSDFFESIQAQLGELAIVAEVLGEITPEVIQLRDQFGLPGMKILAFAFDSGSGSPFLPHNYERNYVVYTGTHDNDTLVGWFYGEQLSEGDRQRIRRYLGYQSADGIHWDLIRLALASVANTAIIPLQDVMGLGRDSRMNLPGTVAGNWSWRYTSEMLHEGLINPLTEMTITYGRILPEALDQGRELLRQEAAPDPAAAETEKV